MTSDLVRLETPRPGVAWVTLNRPEKKNALSEGMWAALSDALATVAEDASVRVLVITGVDGVFCAGADIAGFDPLTRDPVAARAFTDLTQTCQQRLADLPVPTIAKISGPCVGGGCGIALACDFRIGDGSAKLGITPARLGLSYTLADTARVVAAVGAARAKEVLYTGRLYGAEQALAMGLLTSLVAPEDLDGEVDHLIGDLLAVSSTTARTTKRFVARIVAGQTHDDAQTMADYLETFAGADFREGYEAFVAKRRADFGRTHGGA